MSASTSANRAIADSWVAGMGGAGHNQTMSDFDAVATERLVRMLEFLGVSGGAALVVRATRRTVSQRGEIPDDLAKRAFEWRVDNSEQVVHLPPDGLVCDVGVSYRLVVRVGTDPAHATGFAERLRRVRILIERFVLPYAAPPPASAPPGSAPVHAVVFPPSSSRRR